MDATPRSAFAEERIAEQPVREGADIFTATVVDAVELSPGLRRLTLRAAEFRDLVLTGPDEYFGLFMPPPGRRYRELRSFRGGNIRAHADYLPPEERPGLRWYTVRRLAPKAGELCFDVATHGVSPGDLDSDGGDHSGPGLRFTLGARPGERVGYYPAQGLWRGYAERQILIADASSAPSVWAILEFVSLVRPEALSSMHVLLVVEGDGDLEPGAVDAWRPEVGSLRVARAPFERQAAAAAAELRSLRAAGHPATGAGYAWACGERSLAKACRDELVGGWGVSPDDVRWTPYWILGRPRP
ncbi:siderophore-interacting protein [Corynebacterium otitidis]